MTDIPMPQYLLLMTNSLSQPVSWKLIVKHKHQKYNVVTQFKGSTLYRLNSLQFNFLSHLPRKLSRSLQNSIFRYILLHLLFTASTIKENRLELLLKLSAEAGCSINHTVHWLVPIQANPHSVMSQLRAHLISQPVLSLALVSTGVYHRCGSRKEKKLPNDLFHCGKN